MGARHVPCGAGRLKPQGGERRGGDKHTKRPGAKVRGEHAFERTSVRFCNFCVRVIEDICYIYSAEGDVGATHALTAPSHHKRSCLKMLAKK